MKIKLHSAKQVNETISVDYVIASHGHTTKISQQINRKELIKYIIDNELNLFNQGFSDYAECCTDDYLNGFLYETVYGYLIENLK